MIKLTARLRNESARFIQSLVKLTQYSFIRVIFVSSYRKMKRTSQKHDFKNRNMDKLKNTHSNPDTCRNSTLDKRTLRSKFRRLARSKILGYQTDKQICNEQQLSAKEQKES